MKILSLILSTTMLINSIPCANAYAGPSQNLEDGEFSQTQSKRASATPVVGTDDFKELVQKGSFVDKTRFIEAIISDPDKNILITRPRRWGKSLAFSMLKYFLNREVDSNGERIVPNPNRVLFSGGQYTFFEEVEKKGKLEKQEVVINISPPQISKFQDFITKHQGQYPTIFISLKDVEAGTYQSIENRLRLKISQVFGEHSYLLNSLHKQSKDHSDYAKKEKASLALGKFNAILAEKSSDKDLENSLRFLSELLHNHHGQHTYILIDEYDTPLHQVSSNSALSDVTNLLRGLFSTACKSNLAVEKCLFTGILRIAQANLLSGLNNPGIYTLLDSKYAEYYGFTQKEVNKLFEGRQLSEFEYPADRSIVPLSPSTRELSAEHTHKLRKKTAQEENKVGESQEQSNELTQELARIYNGYLIGGIKLYNPWSIVNVLSDKVLRPYWVDSGGVSYIKDALFSNKANEIWNSVKDRKSFSTQITKDVSINNIRKPDSLASLLFHAGYLTLEREQPNRRDRSTNVVIPNEEVHREFERLLETYLSADFNKLEKAKRVFDSIIVQNLTELETALSDFGSKIEFTPGWNFNFLQIAALTGNKAIFECALAYDKDLLDNRLGMGGLGVADYAVLAREHYYQLGGYSPILQKPGFWYGAICSQVGSAGSAAAVGGLTAWGFGKFHDALYGPLNEVPFGINMNYIAHAVKYTGVPYIMGAGIGWALKTYLLDDLTMYCMGYHEYEKIDVSKPASINFIKQLEKYLTENSGSYISLDNRCKSGTEPMTVLKIPAVNIEGIPVTTLSLTLCDVLRQGDL